MGRAKGWTCQRQSGGVVCKHKNLSRMRNCAACGKARPARRKPAHMAGLEITYEEYVKLNGGERCGICGRPPSRSRRLDRDHDHKTGAPRGLLCSRCNRALPNWMDAPWLAAAIRYLLAAALHPRRPE